MSFARYRRLLAKMLSARLAGDTATEDRLLDEMDGIWYALDKAGRESSKELSRQLATGELPEARFIAQELSDTASASVDVITTSSGGVRCIIFRNLSLNSGTQHQMLPDPAGSFHGVQRRAALKNIEQEWTAAGHYMWVNQSNSRMPVIFDVSASNADRGIRQEQLA